MKTGLLLLCLCMICIISPRIMGLSLILSSALECESGKTFIGPGTEMGFFDTSFENSALCKGNHFINGCIPVSLSAGYYMALGVYNGSESLFNSRITELLLTLELGDFMFLDIGKKIITSKTGYFYSPADFIQNDRGLLNTISMDVEGDVTEGSIGAGLEVMIGTVSLREYVLPLIMWNDDIQEVLCYITKKQPAFQNLIELSFTIFDLDFCVSAFYNEYWSFGFSQNTLITDEIVFHIDSAVHQKDENIIVTDIDTMQTATENVEWYMQALLGVIVSPLASTTIVLEYLYNGRGLAGRAYNDVIGYTYNLFEGGSDQAFSLFNSYHHFQLAQHYVFLSIEHNFPDEKLSYKISNATNLFDLSGVLLINMKWQCINYILYCSLSSFYGKTKSQWGIIPQTFQGVVGCTIFML